MAKFAGRHFWLIVAGLILLLAGVQVGSIRGESATWDEGIHIAAGYGYWATGEFRFNLEHPPLMKLLNAAPLHLLLPPLNLDPGKWARREQVPAGADLLYKSGPPPDTILLVARSVTILVTCLFAAWIAYWTRQHFGYAVALWATTLFCLDPNLIAHGRYVTSDVAAAFFLFLASTLWIDYLLKPSRARLVLCGIVLGLALATKYSTLILLLVMPALYWIKYRGQCWRRVGALLAIAAVVVAASYGPEVFRGGGLGLLRRQIQPTGPPAQALFAVARRLPVPAYSYLVGLGFVSLHGEEGRPSYLLGQFSQHGWWYYFPVAALVKTPLGTLLALLAALVACSWTKFGDKRFVLLGLALPAAVFTAFCLGSNMAIGHRHLLPVYAFLFVLSGHLLLRIGWRWLAVAALVLTAAESLAIYPHYLSFINVAAGGPDAGPRYLLDSNIDWGQDLKKLGPWMAQHSVEEISLDMFGWVDMERLGIRSKGFPATEAELRELDGVAAISVTPLYGLYSGPDKYRWLRSQTPVGKAGYSVYVYDFRKLK